MRPVRAACSDFLAREVGLHDELNAQPKDRNVISVCNLGRGTVALLVLMIAY